MSSAQVGVEPDDDQTARIVGAVSDGSPAPPPPPPGLPEFRILDTRLHLGQDRTVTVHRVERSDLPERQEQPEVEPPTEKETQAYLESEEYQRMQEGQGEIGFCMISATVFDHHHTLFRWWPKGAEAPLEAWSNIDFNHLAGFHEFEARGQRYLFMLALENTAAARLAELQADRSAAGLAQLPDPAALPALSTAGPKYMVIAGEAVADWDTEVVEALHNLYAAEGARLREAHTIREQHRLEREAQAAAVPPGPEEVTIHFWRGKREEGDR